MLSELLRRQGYVNVGVVRITSEPLHMTGFTTGFTTVSGTGIRDWHPGLDQEVGSILEWEYSVAQSPPGDYIYVKWWDIGPIFASLAVEDFSV